MSYDADFAAGSPAGAPLDPVIMIGADPDRLCKFGNLTRQLWKTSRRILNVKKRFGESIKVMDGARARHGGDRGCADIPVI